MLALDGVWSKSLLSGVVMFARIANAAVQAPQSTTAEGNKAHETTAAAVFARVELLRGELELIRYELGKSKNRQLRIGVSAAAPREAYFQAVTLFRKANRLAFEQSGTMSAELESLARGDVQAGHVLDVVDLALQRVMVVKDGLGIPEDVNEPPRRSDVEMTDVFSAILQANRQINLMLDQEFSPSDVFEQTTLAIGYAARLLAQFPDARRIPDAPPFERGKRPPDVYRRLLSCYDVIRQIARHSEIDMPTLDVDSVSIESVRPGDVYDLTALILAELAHLRSRLDDPQPPPMAYFAGRKIPSHVYQRVGILQAQLQELLERVSSNPDWLE